jgi:hypothetical protein
VVCSSVDVPWTGEIRIPPENLSAMIVGLTPAYNFNNLAAWNSPGISAALGESNLLIQGTIRRQHTFVERTEAATQNKYLLQYAKEMGPTAWDLRKQEYPQFPWEPIGERFSPRTFSISGIDSQIGKMAISGLDPATNARPESWSGNAGPIPTTLITKTLADYPTAGFRVAQIQNKHGDWVAPTKESIDLALAAGTTPNIAAFNDVPGAYPMVHINNLYTVGGTLTPDEANALAATVRYIVTDGQDAIVRDGGTTLTSGLRTEALQQANRIVEVNCTDPAYQVTSGGPSVFEPDTPQVQALTSLKHCILKPVAETTTTVSQTTTTSAETSTTVALTSSSSPPSVPVVTPIVAPIVRPNAAPTPNIGPAKPQVNVPPPDFGAPTDQPNVDSTTPSEPIVASQGPLPTGTTIPAVDVGGGGGQRPRGLALQALPLAKPDDGSRGFKKLGTLLLGAALFVFVRRAALARQPKPAT